MGECDVVTGVIGRRSRQKHHLRAIAITSTMQGYCHVRVVCILSYRGEDVEKETTDVGMRY